MLADMQKERQQRQTYGVHEGSLGAARAGEIFRPPKEKRTKQAPRNFAGNPS